MKKLLVLLLAVCSIALYGCVYAEKGTYVDTVRFIQYLDENTALEEVRNGNLDMYYYRISADRLEGVQARDGLNVYDSTGGSYSILVNPAESDDRFNPFHIKDVRFALNYLVDRKLVVNELMGGFGSPTISYYGPHDPEYLTIIGQLESFNFKYNPKLAQDIISTALTENGAMMSDGLWMFDDMPIEITMFIRSDDPVRKAIGEILSSKLQDIGFVVKKDFGDLNKAFVVVYGSDPADLKWNLYTEGWARSAFVRYDSVGLGQMYSPWFSNMPGFNDPSYWNYTHDELDSITQKIYTGEFESEKERAGLIQNAIVLGIKESVRIFLASKTDQYVANDSINGVVNDFGAGVPSRFTPINSRSMDGELVIGVKQIYQGAWNPVMGLSDSYSNHIWGVIADPATFKHPFTGETFPVRASWNVKTNGPDGAISLPEEAIMWDVESQKWQRVATGSKATSMVTFDLQFSNWHNGQKMDMNDILYALYFTKEWGTHTGENDRTFDTEFTPRASQIVDTIIGINQIDHNTIQVYVDYWHFDEGEIADWASLWSVVPWEITAAMEEAVLDGKVSFSRSGATSKNVNWLSLLVPNDAHMLQGYVDGFMTKKYIPAAIADADWDYVANRYESSTEWIKEHNHAVISNGPFRLDSYSPESRTITLRASSDDTYPFAAGHWSNFEEAGHPKITNVQISDTIQKGNILDIDVDTNGATSVLYFLSAADGSLISSKESTIKGNAKITIPGSDTRQLRVGANDIKIFAVSEDVLRPDFYSTSILVSERSAELPDATINDITDGIDPDYDIGFLVLAVILAITLAAILVILVRKRLA
ncbi:MAG: ABC transporter substrate-binding protein [Thaumarchaeota archaeon]|nr:ABC transporter substrate-binding protein [Nitrososphaerota archaeon]